jgi:hypothetical protein
MKVAHFFPPLGTGHRRGALGYMTELSCRRAANFEVFELSERGTPERLLARLSIFDDARAIAEIAKDKSRVVMHFGEIVWQRSSASKTGQSAPLSQNAEEPCATERSCV